MRTAALLAGAAAIGCLGCRSPAQDRAQARMAKLRAEVSAAHVWPSCADSPPNAKECGLLSDAWTPAAIARFVVEQCHEEVEQPSDACTGLWADLTIRALRKRYFAADIDDVVGRCRLEGCKSSKDLEFRFLELHNSALATYFDQRAGEIEQDRQGEERERTRAIGMALAAAMNAYAQALFLNRPLGPRPRCRM